MHGITIVNLQSNLVRTELQTYRAPTMLPGSTRQSGSCGRLHICGSPGTSWKMWWVSLETACLWISVSSYCCVRYCTCPDGIMISCYAVAERTYECQVIPREIVAWMNNTRAVCTVLKVLATMVEDCQAPQLSPAAKSVPAAVWQLISDALSAGAATLSTTAAAAASQPVCFDYLRAI